MAYGAPDPNAPEGVGNLGNFIYVGTSAGQIYVTQDGGGSGTSNNWINITAGLSTPLAPVREIITDPIRGSHDAYAVTTNGVYFISNSVTNFSGALTSGSATVTGLSSTTGLVVGGGVTGTGIPSGATILAINSVTNTLTLSAAATASGVQDLTATGVWVNIDPANQIQTLAYNFLGQNYNPADDTANAVKLNQAITLSSIIADWRYQIPNNPNNPAAGYHPALYVGAGNSFSDGSGVFQSLDNGVTWTLFPSMTYGAVAQGGDFPNAPVTDLDMSLGNIDANTGMPDQAGPYQTFVFSGTLVNGSATVTGISGINGVSAAPTLVVGDTIAGTGIPAGTTILSVSGSSIKLSANATATGSQTLAAANANTAPDPDVLLASTYGRGQFAINLPPLILQNPTTQNFVTVAPTTTTPGTTVPTVAGPITISGSSEITGFGDTTWITIEDITNPGAPVVIGGFNPAKGAAVPSSSNSTSALGIFSINFDPASYYMSNGPKTIEIFATDNAGLPVGNKSGLQLQPQRSQSPPAAAHHATHRDRGSFASAAVEGTNRVPTTGNRSPSR